MVSVIIPTYNRAHFIGRAIQSVLNQTYQDFEIIIIDDGSTDNTEEVVRGFGDERIRYIQLKENSGASAVPRNTGLRAARGKYIAFLDSDDEWLLEKIEKQIDKFRRTLSNNIGVVYCGFYYVSEKSGQVVHTVIPRFRGDVYTRLLENNIMGGLTPLIKKNCFEKAGYFDETLSRSQDYDMWIRLSKYYEFDFVMEMLARYHVHKGQRSPNLNAQIQTKEQLIKKYRVDLLKNPAIFSKRLEHLGKLHYLAGHLRKGRKCFLASIRYSPLRKINYIHLLYSLLAPGRYTKMVTHMGWTIDEVTFY